MLLKNTKTGELTNNVNADEIAKFDRLAETWWDPNGKFRTALLFNQTRLNYFVTQIKHHFDLTDDASLNGLRVLDVGSGGGLVAESLAALGADVLGIDASSVSVQVAQAHARKSGVKVAYAHMLADELLATGQSFDVVINAEVIEHVPDQAALVADCCHLTAANGLLIMATLNRTLKSYIIGILGGEYIMRYLPIGTHDWRLFVKPQDMIDMVKEHGGNLRTCTGMSFNPLKQEWRLSPSLAVNYIQCYAMQEAS